MSQDQTPTSPDHPPDRIFVDVRAGFTDSDRALLQSLHRHITGGSEWEGGLLNRTARLEQTQRNTEWWARTALTAAIGAVVVGAVSLFKGTPP